MTEVSLLLCIPCGSRATPFSQSSFMQVSAHGTGARIPPVDEQVISYHLITPAFGKMELSDSQHPFLFRLARVGLGALGIVADATLQCVDAHLLSERTFVTTSQQVCSTFYSRYRNPPFVPNLLTRFLLRCDSVRRSVHTTMNGSAIINTFVTCGFRTRILSL